MIKSVTVLGTGTAGLIAALSLRQKYPWFEISLISSKDVGIIGVGEGSTEHWDEFIRFVNIDHRDLIYKTDATIKIGILFRNWNKGTEYIHSVGYHQSSLYNGIEIFDLLNLRHNAKFPLSPEFDRFYYHNNVVLTPGLKPSNQYHFDTHKLNAFLIDTCKKRNIRIIEGFVKDVMLGETGEVSHLQLEDETNIKSDFFIDCSGFRKVISSAVGCKWVSYLKNLPMNRAVVFPTEFDNPEEIEPYTTATAHSSGWSWKIPTQQRYGNGYVFCDGYIDSNKALDEFSASLNKEIKTARDIKFEAGRLDNFWVKNVVSIGLASSFAEPLEAQSIGFSIIQSKALLEYLDLWFVDKTVNKTYNDRMNAVYDNIVSYLQLHYETDRSDSEFWSDRPYELTDLNKQVIELAKKGIVNSLLFDKPHLMFRVANWYQILAGLNILDKAALAKNLRSKGDAHIKSFEDLTLQNLKNVENTTAISHRSFLDLVKFNYELKNENRNSLPALG